MEILDDPKMGNLSDHLFKRAIEMFLLAGDYDKDGFLPPEKDISWRLRANTELLHVDIEELIERGILEIIDNKLNVKNFAKWQAGINVNERMRRYREQKKKDIYYGDVTEDVTSRNTDKSRVDKNRIDKNRIDKSRVEVEVDAAAPTPYSRLSTTFVNISGIPELSGGVIRYNESIKKMVEMGVTPEILEEAILEMRDKDFTIVSPGSCINACAIVIGKKRGKRRDNDEEDYTRYLKGEYGEFGSH
jgi:hypothetical protein